MTTIQMIIFLAWAFVFLAALAKQVNGHGLFLAIIIAVGFSIYGLVA